MKALISGAGLLGCYAAKNLIDNGYKVTLYDWSPNYEYIHKVVKTKDIKVVGGDIRDLKKIVRILKRARPSVVIHTAALLKHKIDGDPLEGISVNVLGTSTLAHACHLAGIRNFVFCSSLSVYNYTSPQNRPIAEDYPIGPESVYDSTKRSSELLLDSLARKYDINVTTLRFASIYGFGLFNGGAWLGKQFHDILLYINQRKAVAIKEEDFGTNEYIYVEDAAQAIVKVSNADIPTEATFNIGSGVITTTRQLVDAFSKLDNKLSIKMVTSHNTELMPSFIKRKYPFDITKAKEVLGYNPKFSIGRGIRQYYQILKQNV